MHATPYPDRTSLPLAERKAAIKSLCEQSRAARAPLPADAQRQAARKAAR